MRRFGVLLGVLGWAGALLTLMALAPSSKMGTAPETADPADSLIANWIDAIGGTDMYGQFQSASFTITTVLYDTVSGREKRSRPRYVWLKKGPYGEETRVERWETGGLIQQGFNGRDQAWAAIDNVMLPDTAKDTREALYVSRDLFYWFGLPFKLRDPGVFLDYRGMTALPGKPWVGEPAKKSPDSRYHAVGVSFGQGVGEHQDVFTYYFAPGRATPVEATYVEEGRENVNRLVWGDTERVNHPIRYPYVPRRDWLTLSGKRTKALLVTDVVINPEIPQTRFEKP